MARCWRGARRSPTGAKPTATLLEAGNYLEFGYDWRLSNRLNAQRLADRVLLDRWRSTAAGADSRLVLICHSMGGLVARWFLEKLGGHEVTRRLITVGTPYRGSLRAALALSNGLDRRLGPLEISLTAIVRSLPSVHQLLPTYRCLDSGGDSLSGLADADLPDVDRRDIDDALAFHAAIAEAAAKPRYAISALVGISQPTVQSIRLESGRLVGLASYLGTDMGGDGTVPRVSAHPTEWEDDSSATHVGQQHALLQNDPDSLRQIFAILTARSFRPMGAAQNLGLDLPDMIAAGESLDLSVRPDPPDDRLALAYEARPDAGGPPRTGMLRNAGGGLYEARIADLGAGTWRVQVGSAVAAVAVKPVEGLTLVWA